MPAFATKAVLSTPEAIPYVGGERIFLGLRQHHQAIMRPLSRTPNGRETWRVATLDAALAAAEAAGTFIESLSLNPKSKRNLKQGTTPPTS
jgi:hypothetical protein